MPQQQSAGRPMNALPLWRASNLNISQFVTCTCPCVTCVCLVMCTGKRRGGPKERHRWHGGGGDQVRRLYVLRHARSDGTVAVLPGAWCQIMSPGTPEEKGKQENITLHIADNLDLIFYWIIPMKKTFKCRTVHFKVVYVRVFIKMKVHSCRKGFSCSYSSLFNGWSSEYLLSISFLCCAVISIHCSWFMNNQQRLQGLGYNSTVMLHWLLVGLFSDPIKVKHRLVSEYKDE